MKIGLLALQGDYFKHQQMLEKLQVETVFVKTKEQLEQCDGLIIPGGESTTFSLLLHKHDLWNPLQAYARKKPVFGTCAGMIILSNKVNGGVLETLGAIDIEVARNAYGRQVDSFIDTIRLSLGDDTTEFEGVFIRAPKIKKMGENVRPLAWHADNVVMAESGNVVVASFHPELSNNPAVHAYFCRKIENSQ